jgi:hypothetical protein
MYAKLEIFNVRMLMVEISVFWFTKMIIKQILDRSSLVKGTSFEVLKFILRFILYTSARSIFFLYSLEFSYKKKNIYLKI